jgi:hypothetical protein
MEVDGHGPSTLTELRLAADPARGPVAVLLAARIFSL